MSGGSLIINLEKFPMACLINQLLDSNDLQKLSLKNILLPRGS